MPKLACLPQFLSLQIFQEISLVRCIYIYHGVSWMQASPTYMYTPLPPSSHCIKASLINHTPVMVLVCVCMDWPVDPTLLDHRTVASSVLSMAVLRSSWQNKLPCLPLDSDWEYNQTLG
jgi:hypothetical protein